ncbi:E3 ubiquitin-protein ligase UPL6-like [Rhododendron vialii]|uniref:E3 ubiquitin-protein ligase UPL6-like n=1 Tax=Rhododendron vialii TaxID=182163 RepID=UPI00265E0B09|nr:E3 ubiquitin-protein ligase UPL6-like [Rhododendron vialii]
MKNIVSVRHGDTPPAPKLFPSQIFFSTGQQTMLPMLPRYAPLVPVLWKFMKQCHENQKWSALSGHLTYLPADAPGWLLPLTVFCPVYKHMLMIVVNGEFDEQEKPLSLKDVKCLIVILRQALWQLLWVNPVASPNVSKSTANVFSLKRHPLEFFQHRVSIVASDLLSQETMNHLLYPNPGSLMVHEHHLQYFHFLELFLQR